MFPISFTDDVKCQKYKYRGNEIINGDKHPRYLYIINNELIFHMRIRFNEYCILKYQYIIIFYIVIRMHIYFGRKSDTVRLQQKVSTGRDATAAFPFRKTTDDENIPIFDTPPPSVR